MDEHTLFAIGSATKAFTASSLAMLVSEGKFDRDDPVTELMPGFRLHDPYVTREINVRDPFTLGAEGDVDRDGMEGVGDFKRVS